MAFIKVTNLESGKQSYLNTIMIFSIGTAEDGIHGRIGYIGDAFVEVEETADYLIQQMKTFGQGT